MFLISVSRTFLSRAFLESDSIRPWSFDSNFKSPGEEIKETEYTMEKIRDFSKLTAKIDSVMPQFFSIYVFINKYVL